MAKIYEIWHDTDNYGKEDYDGIFRGDKFSVPASTSEQSQQRLSKAPKEMPESFDFDTDNPERLQNVNIALHTSNLDIFSKNLLDVISSVGSIEWTLIPTRFFNTSTKKEVCEGQFSAVFFEYFIDCFDYELSEYRPALYPDHFLERARKEVGTVNKLVLKEPDGGFPPYFRVLADPLNSLINAETYDAIVKADIQGVNMRLIGDF